MADDDKLLAAYIAQRAQHMLQHGQTADLMQNLGRVGAHARAFARRHNQCQFIHHENILLVISDAVSFD